MNRKRIGAAATGLFFLVAARAVARDAGASGAAFRSVEWVTLTGGTFMMGTNDSNFVDVTTLTVTLKTFDISKTLVTVEQYAECVKKGKCRAPDKPSPACNWGHKGRELHPINCVIWERARQYARFMGGRLPSESEWEYAARSGGKQNLYPWGDEAAGCERAVMYGNDGYGCGTDGTWPVCSKPAGNTEQGLCDMAGNVWQWVEDKFEETYKNTPADGRPNTAPGSVRVTRGGSYRTRMSHTLKTRVRGLCGADDRLSGFGFRIARDKK